TADVSVGTTAGLPVEVELAATDADGDPLVLTVATQPSSGTLGAVLGSLVTYTPAPGFVGDDSFTYVASDGTATSAPATVSITVGPTVEEPGVPAAVAIEPATRTATVGTED